jgi:pimeloyl-ACP methyl ester carboxylesterase
MQEGFKYFSAKMSANWANPTGTICMIADPSTTPPERAVLKAVRRAVHVVLDSGIHIPVAANETLFDTGAVQMNYCSLAFFQMHKRQLKPQTRACQGFTATVADGRVTKVDNVVSMTLRFKQPDMSECCMNGDFYVLENLPVSIVIGLTDIIIKLSGLFTAMIDDAVNEIADPPEQDATPEEAAKETNMDLPASPFAMHFFEMLSDDSSCQAYPYNIHALVAYRGDPLDRLTMEFLIRHRDGLEAWIPWTESLFATLAYETYCKSVPALFPLVTRPSVTRQLIRDMNKRTITEVAGVVSHYGYSDAVVVGHDWGGSLAWSFSAVYPSMVSKLVVLAGPNMKLYVENISLEQTLRSFYFLLFQVPVLPELYISLNDYEVVEQLMQSGLYSGSSLTSEDITMTKYFFSQPDVCRCGVNFYRNMFSMTINDWRQLEQKIEVPCLVIWGDSDCHLSTSLCKNLQSAAPKAELVVLEGCTHWVQLERPEEVNALMAKFISS